MGRSVAIRTNMSKTGLVLRRRRDPKSVEKRKMNEDGRMTITQAALAVGVSPKTIRRWEESGKVPKAKKDWRGWRVYFPGDVEQLMFFHEALH